MNTKKLIRQNFRNEVFARDGNKCVFCEKTQDLDAHHIIDRNEMPNGGYVLENGISLCPEHHRLAEVYHNSKKEVWAAGFHPDDLYEFVGSSYKIAYEKSLNLRLTN